MGLNQFWQNYKVLIVMGTSLGLIHWGWFNLKSSSALRSARDEFIPEPGIVTYVLNSSAPPAAKSKWNRLRYKMILTCYQLKATLCNCYRSTAPPAATGDNLWWSQSDEVFSCKTKWISVLTLTESSQIQLVYYPWVLETGKKWSGRRWSLRALSGRHLGYCFLTLKSCCIWTKLHQLF